MSNDTTARALMESTHELTGSMLSEALPYIQRFAGKVVVVKYGGNALAGSSDVDAASTFARDIALMHAVGIKPVVVHGGGPQISALMERLGKKPEFRNGLRVTDQETIEIASMVLLGTVNPQLVSAINVHGARAVGVSGQDAGLLQVTQRDPDLGFVGDIHAVDPTVLLSAINDCTIFASIPDCSSTPNSKPRPRTITTCGNLVKASISICPLALATDGASISIITFMVALAAAVAIAVPLNVLP